MKIVRILTLEDDLETIGSICRQSDESNKKYLHFAKRQAKIPAMVEVSHTFALMQEGGKEADALISQMKVVDKLSSQQRSAVRDLAFDLIMGEKMGEIDKAGQLSFYMGALDDVRVALEEGVPREILTTILDRESLRPQQPPERRPRGGPILI